MLYNLSTLEKKQFKDIFKIPHDIHDHSCNFIY